MPPPDLDTPPVVIRQSRAVLGLLLGLDAALLCLPILAFTSGELKGDSVTGAAVALGLFTLAGLFVGVTFLRPATLTIGPEGLVHRTLFRTRSLSWTDVQSFFVLSIRFRWATSRMAAYTLRPDLRRPGAAMDRWRAANGGADGSVGGGYTLRVGPLVDLLNRARRKWGPR